jgi:O-antigen ligase
MIQKITYNNITLVISFLLWFFLFGSINIYPINLLNIKSVFDFADAARIIIPITIGVLIFIFLIIKILKNKKKINISNYLTIFFFIFFFQLVGAFFEDRINFETLYVIFFSFTLILLFVFVEYLKIQRVYFFFLYSLIFFILTSCLILLVLKFEEFFIAAKALNFYTIFHPDISLIGHAPPRATGYSRMLAIFTIFMIAWVEKKKNIIKNPFTYLVLFLATIIWLFQSRGTYLCYIVSVLSIIFILNHKNNLYKKITKFFFYIFAPITISFFLSILFSYQNIILSKTNIENSKKTNIENSKKTNIENSKGITLNNRILFDKTSSGRIELWSASIKEFEKKNIFGYGPQADRIILTKKYKNTDTLDRYGNNVSNGLVYTFLSGGYLSALLFIILYLKNISLVLQYIKKSRIRAHLPSDLSLIYIIFFSIRSLIENSYAVWGIDQMFVLISMGILNFKLANNKAI